MVTCESGRNAILKLFSYNRFQGFKLLAETYISKAIEVTSISISRDGTRIAVVSLEPLMSLNIYDIEKNEMKLLTTVPIETPYKSCKISPKDKNFIFLMNEKLCTMVEIKDSFPDEFSSMNDFVKFEFQTIKSKEEAFLTKRYATRNLKSNSNFDEFVDFAWDVYNNIYIAESSGEINLYDSNLNKVTASLGGELKEGNIKVNASPTALLLTQRYLLCSTNDGRVSLINIYLSEKDLLSFKPTINNPENYRMFEVEREVTPSIYNNTNKYSYDTYDYIVAMKYSSDYKKIITLSKSNCLNVIIMKAEMLSRDKDEIFDSDVSDIKCYEETKFHSDKLLGVKELGKTSQFVSVGIDQKIIFWELATRRPVFLHEINFVPTVFEINAEGNLLFIGSNGGILRIYNISDRSNIKLIHQLKYHTDRKKLDYPIDKIILDPVMKIAIFYKKEGNIINFISSDHRKNFQFMGYLKTPLHIVDVSINSNLHEILVLSPLVIMSFKIFSYVIDYKSVIDVQTKKVTDIFSNFELKSEKKGRKVDLDINLMIKNMSSDQIWTTGSTKYLKLYNHPMDHFDNLVKDPRKPQDPLKEIVGHDLDITCGIVHEGILITGGVDGNVQIRKRDGAEMKSCRTHSFLRNGVTSIFYSPATSLIYASGDDGSIFLLAETKEELNLPNEPLYNTVTIESLENMDIVEPLNDELVRSLVDIIQEEHNLIVEKNKKIRQANIKTNLEKIKQELKKLIADNSKLDPIEQLDKEEMIIDTTRIEKELQEGQEKANDLIKKYFTELCEKEIIRTKMIEKTYDVCRIKDIDPTKCFNNNIKIISFENRDRLLKSYPVRKLRDHEIDRLNYVKQMRLMELQEYYKRRNENLHKEVIEEKLFSRGEEPYIINRVPVKITLEESEIKPSDIAENVGEGDRGEKMAMDRGLIKVAKYRLQRNPYADEGMTGSKQDDNADQIHYRPDVQLLKEDLVIKFKTKIEYNKNATDVEFTKNLQEIDSFTLLYSPFELYTNFRMRNQIYLLMDIIHNLKINFNKEIKAYVTERNSNLEKFNSFKSSIESIREILVSLGGDVNIENYSYVIHPYEESEWLEKVEASEIKVPKYFSKLEKQKKEEEKKREEERIKALQGDTLERRGLNHMIEIKDIKATSQQSEMELVREPWMDKIDKTDEEKKKYEEFRKKEREMIEMKEKLRSQNMTKLNSLKIDIENLKAEMDLKFLKMVKKKLYYDYRVAEQEIYILALIRTLEYREQLKCQTAKAKKDLENISVEEKKLTERLNIFKENYENFYDNYKSVMAIYSEKNKNNKMLENFEKSNFFGITLNPTEEEYLKKIRMDPYYHVEEENLKHQRKYGSKPYKQIFNQSKSNVNTQKHVIEENLNIINQKYYFDYKNDQYLAHKQFLEAEESKILNERRNAEENFKKLEEDTKKSKLNIDFMIRLRKVNDEIAEISGPQNYIDEALLIDHVKIDQKNRIINETYATTKLNSDTSKDHNKFIQFLELENARIKLKIHEIKLKMRYLKLTRVTKRIQEIVTGREEFDQQQIALMYDQKRKNLEENKNKRVETMIKKVQELENEIDKKERENEEFKVKYVKLSEEVVLKEQINQLDTDEKIYSDDGKKGTK